MQALPLFLDRLADPITAVVLSVTVVLIFGEALCSLRMLSPAHKYWHMSSCKLHDTEAALHLGPGAEGASGTPALY